MCDTIYLTLVVHKSLWCFLCLYNIHVQMRQGLHQLFNDFDQESVPNTVVCSNKIWHARCLYTQTGNRFSRKCKFKARERVCFELCYENGPKCTDLCCKKTFKFQPKSNWTQVMESADCAVYLLHYHRYYTVRYSVCNIFVLQKMKWSPQTICWNIQGVFFSPVKSNMFIWKGYFYPRN